jgi:hypothetical protein
MMKKFLLKRFKSVLYYKNITKIIPVPDFLLILIHLKLV